MKIRHKHTGLTLTEMTVVIAVAALLVGLSMPAARMLQNSFETESGTASMISSALASARAIAAKEQRYAGIRFQKRYDPTNPDSLNASQYMIFIVHDFNRTTLANGFRAVDGIQPIKLPDSVGVMDSNVTGDAAVNTDGRLRDNTAFSIIFSPSGELVIHEVRVRNRDGCPIWTPSGYIDDSRDDIFNTLKMITHPVNPTGMFYQDDYPTIGFAEEQSRNSFYIYETEKLKQVAPNLRWTNYLSRLALKPVYINAYTGTIVSNK
jgi:Tfp pilus assembly protein FimT